MFKKQGVQGDEKGFSVVLQNENDIDTFKRNTIENTPSITEITGSQEALHPFSNCYGRTIRHCF